MLNIISKEVEINTTDFTLGVHKFDRKKIKEQGKVKYEYLLFEGYPTKKEIMRFKRKGSKRVNRERWNNSFRYSSKRHCGLTLKSNKEIGKIIAGLIDKISEARIKLIAKQVKFNKACNQKLDYKKIQILRRELDDLRKETLSRENELIIEIDLLENNPSHSHRGKKRTKRTLQKTGRKSESFKPSNSELRSFIEDYHLSQKIGEVNSFDAYLVQ